MEKEVKENYIEAGKVIQKARKKAREVAEPGTSFVEIAETVEQLIRDEGLQPAFPVNLSVNEEAAHFTPAEDTERKLQEDDVLKIDIGAQSEGYIADTALTVNPSGKDQEIIDEVEKVLEEALDFLEPGVTVGELGTFIEKQVPDEYNIVQNLTGHSLGNYNQHAGLSIPNKANTNSYEFQEGDAVAIEPFLTTGTGTVKNGRDGNIYKLESERSVRSRTARQLMKKIKNYRGLPFTTRWMDLSGKEKMAFRKLLQQNIVRNYPVLQDKDGSVVAQAEHTVLVGADDGENVVTTRR
ncbi:type II methionyl aminopeptidase [Candidatus Nanohalococcus occultus]|uniref:Methionine aminopeptidase n=1 Tax=Candidatus Nanohalococcus occultus TaxID=2978047 RepID=A0ABY8CD00_9ARCH|nr:Methionine aminopeptidase [Candidatus Nanohaloarchaeota archaeon SVXNc]